MSIYLRRIKPLSFDLRESKSLPTIPKAGSNLHECLTKALWVHIWIEIAADESTINYDDTEHLSKLLPFTMFSEHILICPAKIPDPLLPLILGSSKFDKNLPTISMYNVCIEHPRHEIRVWNKSAMTTWTVSGSCNFPTLVGGSFYN